MREYFSLTHKASYNFIFAGILLIFYEISILLFSGDAQVVNGVDKLFQFYLNQIPNGTIIVSLLLILACIVAVLTDKKEGTPLQASNFVFMWFESAFWALFVFFNLGFLVSLIPTEYINFLNGIAPQDTAGVRKTGLLMDIGLSFGAGFYEELFFRLMLVYGLNITFRLLGKSPDMILNRLGIIALTAALFSLAHFKFIIGEMGDDWNLYAFVYRFVFGVMMSVLLIFRGFGITAWTHALYDVLVYIFRAI